MKHVKQISAEDKAEFVDLLRDGIDHVSAARSLDSTGTQYRRLRSPQSQWFDPEFAQACHEAENSPERVTTRIQRLEGAFWQAVEDGKQWAVEKGLYAYHPDFEHLRHTNLRVSGSIEHTARMILPHLSDDEIKERLAEIEKRKAEGPHLLGPAHDEAA